MAVVEAPGRILHAFWESTDATLTDDAAEIEAAE